jgi:hypothetical protein
MKGPDYARMAEDNIGTDRSCHTECDAVRPGDGRSDAHCRHLRALPPGDHHLGTDGGKVHGRTQEACLTLPLVPALGNMCPASADAWD